MLYGGVGSSIRSSRYKIGGVLSNEMTWQVGLLAVFIAFGVYHHQKAKKSTGRKKKYHQKRLRDIEGSYWLMN